MNAWQVPMAGTPTQAALTLEYRRRQKEIARARESWLHAAYMADEFLGPALARVGFSPEGYFKGLPVTGTPPGVLAGGYPAANYRALTVNRGAGALLPRLLTSLGWPQMAINERNSQFNEAHPTYLPYPGKANQPSQRRGWKERHAENYRTWWLAASANGSWQLQGTDLSPAAWYAQYLAVQSRPSKATQARRDQAMAELRAWYAAELARFGYTDVRPSRGKMQAGARAYLNKLADLFKSKGQKFGPVPGSDKPGQKIRPGSPLDQSGGVPRPPNTPPPPYQSPQSQASVFGVAAWKVAAVVAGGLVLVLGAFFVLGD